MVLISAAVLADAPVRDHNIVADDYFTLATITGCRMSPDGRYVAYTEMRWDKELDGRNTDLWVVSTQTKEVTRLTFDPAADVSPQWSPDSRRVYFSTSRTRPGEEKPPYNGKTQVWRIGVEGGEPLPVTRLPDGIEGFELSHDGKALYYQVSEKQVDDEFKELREQFSELEYGHGVTNFSQIWRLDLSSWRSDKLVDESRVIREFAVSPDQRRIAMITTPTEELISHEGRSRVDIYDAKSKEVTTLPDKQWRDDAPTPYGWLEGLAWTSDGESLAMRIDFDGYPGEIFVAHWRSQDKPIITKLLRHDEMTPSGTHMEWLPGSKDLCFTAEDRARDRVYCQRMVAGTAQAKAVILTPGDVCASAFSVSGAGDRLAIVMDTVTHPPDIFTVPPTGRDVEYTRITKVNPQVDTWKLPQIRTVQWTSSDGTKVEGILELPPDYDGKPGQPLPLMVECHGGPTACTRLRLRLWIYGRTLFAARGWALLSPNYRGSTGYGDKFLTDLIGNKNNLDVEDILAGVDAMIERGIADPDRLAVMGWSAGGYLTDCLVSRTNRFKAASSGAGIFDVATQWLSEDTPGHVINYQQGFPWNRTEAMRAGSALYSADKIRTPTIIHVGGNDRRCPPVHSTGLYRALHEYLKVPCELIVYPGAGHGLRTYKHRKAKMEWDLKWFDRYVAVEQPGDEAESAVLSAAGSPVR